MKTLEDKLKAWVVNDYFTPNIKAEVILDTLLTPYIGQIVKSQLGERVTDLIWLTKEMSVSDENSRNNRGEKIDYILTDTKAVYLVELKTTDSSIDSDQAKKYLENCRKKTFGEVFGTRLLKIIRDSFAGTYQKEFIQRFGDDPGGWNDDTIHDAFWLIFSTEYLGKRYGMEEPDRPYANAAIDLIRKAGWAQSDSNRSRKYLYTMGQLLDYMEPDSKERRNLWNLPLRLVYLTPAGSLPHEDFLKFGDFYWYPEYPKYPEDPKKEGSVSLMEAGKYLAEKKEDELAQLLGKIIKDIYGE